MQDPPDPGTSFTPEVPGLPRETQPSLPIRRGWYLLVRVTFLLCVILPALLALEASLFLFPLGVPPLAVFVFHAWRFDSLLRGQRVRSAMALAEVTASVSWLSFTALWLVFLMGLWPPISWDDVKSADWITAIPLGFALLAPTTLLLGSIKVRRAARPEPSDSSNLAKVLGMGTLYMAAVLFSGALTLAGLGRSRLASNQASAIASLRVVNTAALTYERTYGNGFPPNLGALGPPTNKAQPSASAAALIDELLAKGERRGYTFAYTPGLRDSKGKIETYTVTARPLNSTTGTVNYFTDQTGVIRQTTEDRPATAKDAPIPD